MRVNCKSFTYFIFTFIMAIGSTACGDSTKKEIKSVMSGEITGDINESYVASRAIMECDPGVLNVLDMAFSKISFNISIPMPLLKEGEHPLTGEHDSYTILPKDSKSVLISYEASNEKLYGNKVKGTISFSSIPKKIGEHLTGYLKGTAQAEKHQREDGKINIDMQFDIIAKSDINIRCNRTDW